MKRTWRQDKETGKFIEIAPSRDRPKRVEIIKPFEPFISPVTRQPIMTRAALREHNRVHKVTNSSDYTEYWAKEERRRERFHNGEYSTADRIELRNDINDAIQQASSSGYVPEFKKQEHIPELDNG
jgi:hypothetical protein